MVRVSSTQRAATRASSRLPVTKVVERRSLLARPTNRTSEIPGIRGSRVTKDKRKSNTVPMPSSLLNRGPCCRRNQRPTGQKSVRFEGALEESPATQKENVPVLGNIGNMTDHWKGFSTNSQVGEDFVFEEDPDALASILNNEGVGNDLWQKTREAEAKKQGSSADACLLADGRPSLCRRVPINRASSILPDGSRASLLSNRISAGPGRIARPSVTGRPSATGRTSFNSRRGSVVRPTTQDSLFSFIERRYSQRQWDVPSQPTAHPPRPSILLSSAKPSQQKSVKFQEEPAFRKPDQGPFSSARRVISKKKCLTSAASPALRLPVSPPNPLVNSPALRIRRTARNTPGKSRLADELQSSPKMKGNIVTALDFTEDEENESPEVNVPRPQLASLKPVPTKPQKSISRLKPVTQVRKQPSFIRKPTTTIAKTGIYSNATKLRLPAKNSDRYTFGKGGFAKTKGREEIKTYFVEAELGQGEELIQPKIINRESLEDIVPKTANKLSEMDSVAGNLPKRTLLADDQPSAENLEIHEPKTLNVPKPVKKVSAKPGSRIPAFRAKEKVTGTDAVLSLMRKKLTTIKRRSVQDEFSSVLNSIEMSLASVMENVDENQDQVSDEAVGAVGPQKLPLPSRRVSVLPKPDMRPWKQVLAKESTSPTWSDILKKKKNCSEARVEEAKVSEAPESIAFWTEKTPCPRKTNKGTTLPSASHSAVIQVESATPLASTKVSEKIRQATIEVQGKEGLKVPSGPAPSSGKTNSVLTDMSATRERIRRVLSSKIPATSQSKAAHINLAPQKFFGPIGDYPALQIRHHDCAVGSRTESVREKSKKNLPVRGENLERTAGIRKSATWAENTGNLSDTVISDKSDTNFDFLPKNSPNLIKPKSADAIKWDESKKHGEHKISSGRIGNKTTAVQNEDTSPPQVSERCPIIPVISPSMDTIIRGKKSPILKEKLTPNIGKRSPTDIDDVFTDSPKWDPTFPAVASHQFRGSIKSSSSGGTLSMSNMPDGSLLGPSFYKKYGESKEKMLEEAMKFIYERSPILDLLDEPSRSVFHSESENLRSPRSHPDVGDLGREEIATPEPHSDLENLDRLCGNPSEMPQTPSPGFDFDNLNLSALQSLRIVSMDLKKVPEESRSCSKTATLLTPVEEPYIPQSLWPSGGLPLAPVKEPYTSRSLQPSSGPLAPIKEPCVPRSLEPSSVPPLAPVEEPYMPRSLGPSSGPPLAPVEEPYTSLSLGPSSGPPLAPVEEPYIPLSLGPSGGRPLAPVEEPCASRSLWPSSGSEHKTNLFEHDAASCEVRSLLDLTAVEKGRRLVSLENEPIGFSNVSLLPSGYGADGVALTAPQSESTEALELSYAGKDIIQKEPTATDVLPKILESKSFRGLPEIAVDFSSAATTPNKSNNANAPLLKLSHLESSLNPTVLQPKAVKKTRHQSDLMNFSPDLEPPSGIVEKPGKVFTFTNTGITQSSIAAPKAIKPPPPQTPQAFRLLRQKFRESPTPKKSRARSPFSLRAQSSGVRKTPQKKSKILTSSPHIKTFYKKHFADALLDEEVALFTCRNTRTTPGTPNRRRLKESASNPLGRVLMEGDDMHFIPVSPIVNKRKPNAEAMAGSAFSTVKQGERSSTTNNGNSTLVFPKLF